MNILNSTDKLHDNIQNRLKALSIRAILFDSTYIFISSTDSLFIYDRKKLTLLSHISTMQFGICRKLKRISNINWFISNQATYQIGKNDFHFTKINSPNENDRIFDLATTKNEVFGITYPFGKLLTLQGNRFIEKNKYFNKKQVPLLCIASKGDSLIIGGDKYYCIVVDNSVVFEKDITKITEGLFSDNLAIWDIAIISDRIFFAVGETHRNHIGFLFEHNKPIRKDIFSHYVQTLYYDKSKDALWIGTSNNGLYYWNSVQASKQIGDIQYVQGENSQTSYFINKGKLEIKDTIKTTIPTENITTVKVIGDTAFIFSTTNLFIRNKGILIRNMQVPNRDYKYAVRIGDSLFCFGQYFSSVIINLRNYTFNTIGQNHIISEIVKDGNKVFVHNKNLGFSVYDTNGYHNLKYDNKTIEDIIDFAVYKGNLIVARENLLEVYKIDANSNRLFLIQSESFDSIIQNYKIKWILTDQEGNLFLVLNNGILSYKDNRPISFFYLGKRDLVNKPFFDINNNLTIQAGGYNTIISSKTLYASLNQNIDTIDIHRDITEFQPFKIYFRDKNYITQDYSLKRIVFSLKGKVVFEKYAIANEIDLFTGLGSGNYKMNFFVDGNFIKSQELEVSPPLFKNPAFYLFLGFITTLLLLLIFKNIYDRNKYGKQLFQNRQRLLQLNFNPHFIYNTLNLIYSKILENEREDAAKTLMDFSNFHRIFLERSVKKQVSVKEELDFIGLYISIEMNRFSHDKSFKYELFNHNDINIDTYFLPPNIMQPLVENALKHGVLNYNGNEVNRLIIDINSIGEKLIIGVENPITNTVNIITTSNAGIGLSIVKERITLYNKETKSKISLKLNLQPKYILNGYRLEIHG